MTVDQNESDPRSTVPLPASAHVAPGSSDNPISDWLDGLSVEAGEHSSRTSAAPAAHEH